MRAQSHQDSRVIIGTIVMQRSAFASSTAGGGDDVLNATGVATTVILDGGAGNDTRIGETRCGDDHL